MTKSPNGHSGFAAQLKLGSYGNLIIPANLYSEFPILQTYTNINFAGYYKFNRLGNEFISITGSLIKEGTNVYSKTLIIDEGSNEYSEFVVPIEYWGTQIPDSISISMTFFDDSATAVTLNSWVLIDDLSFSRIVSIKDEFNKTPEVFSLRQNFPNPFNSSTKIFYSIPQTSYVTLKIYDLLGREVATLINEEKSVGNYEVEFYGNYMTSGVYFYRMQTGNFADTKKLILIK